MSGEAEKIYRSKSLSHSVIEISSFWKIRDNLLSRSWFLRSSRLNKICLHSSYLGLFCGFYDNLEFLISEGSGQNKEFCELWQSKRGKLFFNRNKCFLDLERKLACDCEQIPLKRGVAQFEFHEFFHCLVFTKNKYLFCPILRFFNKKYFIFLRLDFDCVNC